MRVMLRQPQAEDIVDLQRLRSDAELQHFLLAHPQGDRSVDSTRAWIERRSSEPNDTFLVAEIDGRCAGFVQIARINRLDRHGFGGICLLPEFRGRGAGAVAMGALLRLAAAQGLRKLLLEVRADNEVALRLYEKLGFRRVGVLADHYDDGRRTYDVVVLETLLQGTK